MLLGSQVIERGGLSDLVKSLDGKTLQSLAEAGLMWLQANRQAVNAVNVFPVPDGDTGTNMCMTMQSACKEVSASPEIGAGAVARAIAHGALMGARGNSGVILSQIWRGMAQSIDCLDVFGAAEFAAAMEQATETAYLGVSKPVEGTMLTVIKDAAAAASLAAEETENMVTCFERVVLACELSVESTPTMLPVLEQAGVVDSGGLGLKFLFEGMLRYLKGEPLEAAQDSEVKVLDMDSVGAALESVEPGQDWEVIVDFRPHGIVDLGPFYSQLEALGTSVQVGQGEDIYRVHIHLETRKRYEPIAVAEALGTVLKISMENLLDQMDVQPGQALIPTVDVHPGQLLAVVVSPGVGFTRILSTEAVSIVSGGHTMNPSTEDFLQAFENLPSNQVIILPNNKNIQLAAYQAAEISVKQVLVLPTDTMPQAIGAMMAFNPDGELDEVYEKMCAQIEEVSTGEVTISTRSVTLDGITCQKGQFIGFHNGKLSSVSESAENCVLDMLPSIVAGERELITLYYGNGVGGSDADLLAEDVQLACPELEVETYSGGQHHYHYIMSAE